MAVKQIKIPDIGADSAEVIEVLVSVGDEIEADQSLAVLESDKASVEVPSPEAGKVVSIAFSVGDQVSEGSIAIELEVTESNEVAEAVAAPEADKQTDTADEPVAATEVETAGSGNVTESLESVLCKVPDVGADDAEIIEVSVAVGDEVREGDSIVVAESDKASLEIPAEFDGIVEALHVSSGDKVSQGSDLVTIAKKVSKPVDEVATENVSDATEVEPPILQDVVVPTESSSSQTYQVPDVGSDAAEVIEILVNIGDEVAEGDSICAVETDKASVEIPAPAAGIIEAVLISTGDKVGEGQDFVKILSVQIPAPASPPEPVATTTESGVTSKEPAASKPLENTGDAPVAKQAAVSGTSSKATDVYAGPATRKHARELGVELAHLRGTGSRGRILVEDINQFVKQKMQSGGASLQSGDGRGLPEIPAVDWAKFGDIEVEPMSRIHKATAANMVRNWLNVPHVTQFDDADVTELEKYRAYLKAEATSRGIKMTPLAFLLKASAVALAENPKMNASLHHNGEDMVFKKYTHIGIAVDTPTGLMVPVVRDVDQKNIWELAADVIALANKAKEGKLGAKDMQGGCFTISSLGAIGGTGFTPIVSAPQVAILGVSKTATKPVWNGTEFLPRQMMPLSVSYDHRAVNGADAGKFMTTLVSVMEDLDRIWNG